MIIQILDTTRKIWLDRCYCSRRDQAEKEVARLERIYKKNKFQIIPGKKNLPGPNYIYVSEDHIQRIEDGLEWIDYQQRDHTFAPKMMEVMQGKFSGGKEWKKKLTVKQKLARGRR